MRVKVMTKYGPAWVTRYPKARKTKKRGATKARLKALRKKYGLGEFSRRHSTLSRTTSREAASSAVDVPPRGRPKTPRPKKPRKKRVPAVPWKWRYHPNPDPQQPPVPWQV